MLQRLHRAITLTEISGSRAAPMILLFPKSYCQTAGVALQSEVFAIVRCSTGSAGSPGIVNKCVLIVFLHFTLVDALHDPPTTLDDLDRP